MAEQAELTTEIDKLTEALAEAVADKAHHLILAEAAEELEELALTLMETLTPLDLL